MAKILIADDDYDICDLLEIMLTRTGHDMVVAHDGAEAWESFTTDEFDLLVLDCMMPHRTGQQVLGAVRTDPAGLEVPVVLMSAEPSDSVVEQAYLLGASAFLSKPFSLAALSAKVDELLT